MSRHRRNDIEKLKTKEGEWIKDNQELKEKNLRYFQKLYTKENFQFKCFLLRKCFPLLSESALKELDSQFLVEEIKSTLFSMAPIKPLNWMAYMQSSFKASGR